MASPHAGARTGHGRGLGADEAGAGPARPGVHGECRHRRGRQGGAEPFSLCRTAEGRGVF